MLFSFQVFCFVLFTGLFLHSPNQHLMETYNDMHRKYGNEGHNFNLKRLTCKSTNNEHLSATDREKQARGRDWGRHLTRG